MMISPAFASSKHVMRELVAKECNAGEVDDPTMHPLAAEEWLGSCILAALADPRAACELALVNKNFRSASKSNLVWQKLLPPPHHLEALLEDCDDKSLQELALSSKKEFYFRLCKSISIDGGLKKFWLDQRTGGECYMLSARSLTIAWGLTPEYWIWLPCPGSWFPEVAVLQSVCWFDISGKFRQLLKPGSYVVSLRMQVRSASIWRWSPIKLCLQNLTSAQPLVESRAFFHRRLPVSDPPLTTPLIPDASQLSVNDDEYSALDQHIWVECDVGRFTVEEDEDGPTEVEFSAREIEVLGWKSGFLLDGVLVRPSNVVDAKERTTASMGSMYGYEDGDDEDMTTVEDGFVAENEGSYNDDSEDDGEIIDAGTDDESLSANADEGMDSRARSDEE